MSTYQDYDAASRLYDYQRSGVGADVMAAMIQFHSGKQLKVGEPDYNSHYNLILYAGTLQFVHWSVEYRSKTSYLIDKNIIFRN